MIRVGIIGSENSHAAAFSKIFNMSGAYPDIRVVAIYGEDRSASEKIHSECNVERLCDHPGDMEGMVDAVMVTSRHGALHYPYAKPFLEAGIPAFIDKPIACDTASALEIVRAAEKSGAKLTGGSSTRLVPDTLAFQAAARAAMEAGALSGGHVWAPVSMFNPYGGYWFYASHLVEIALTIFGYAPYAARAWKTDAGVSAVLDYGRYCAHLSFLEGNYQYGATVLGKTVTTGPIDISGCYELEAEDFARMVQTGETKQNKREFIEAVCVLDAICRAYETGRETRVVNPA